MENWKKEVADKTETSGFFITIKTHKKMKDEKITVKLTDKEYLHFFALKMYCENLIEYKNKSETFAFMVEEQINNISKELTNFKNK